jgi:hypothetical protein
VSNYDSPGHSATLPLAGASDFNPRAQTAPGSRGVPASGLLGTTTTSALLTDPYSGPRADRVSVGPADVNVPGQAPAADPVSGVGGIDATGAGQGRAEHIGHPNNGG